MAQALDRFDASPSQLRRVDLVADRFDRGSVNRQGEERDAVARLRWLALGEKSMDGTILRSLWAAPSGLVLMLLVGTPMVAAQAPGAPPPRQQPPAPQQNQRAEQDRLARQVEELRRVGRFDEAVAVAKRALELERGTGEAMRGQVAEALARLAELDELRGDWVQAVGRRKEALAIRMQVDGKGHWRTADARLALAFAETVAGLGPADRAKVGGALRREQEAARLEVQGKCAEAERVAMEALETYRAVVGPESAEVARAWHRIGRCRSARHDAGGAKQANERALMIRRKVLPGTHPDLGRSPTGRSSWSPIGSSAPPANIAWPAGWRLTSSAIAGAAGSFPIGTSTSESGSTSSSSRPGTAPSISSWRPRRRSRWPSIITSATCSASSRTWCSRTSPAPTSRAPGRPTSPSTATAAMASRTTSR